MNGRRDIEYTKGRDMRSGGMVVERGLAGAGDIGEARRVAAKFKIKEQGDLPVRGQDKEEQRVPVVVHRGAVMPHALRRREAQEVVPAGRTSGSEAGGALFRQPRGVGDFPKRLGCSVWWGEGGREGGAGGREGGAGEVCDVSVALSFEW